MRQPYDTDVTDPQWKKIEMFFPEPSSMGRPRNQNFREILNAILYLLRAGCAWRLLPHDFPKWQTVYYYFRRWQREGVWEKIHDYLRAEIRVRAGRNVQPSAGIVDCQSIATDNHGLEKGFDGGKLIKGRKRHIIVDVMGLLLAVMVHGAGIQERRGLKFLLFKIRHQFPLLKLIWADGGYDGQPLQKWMKRWFDRIIQVVKRNEDVIGFEVLPRRWVVERTFAWFGRYRRLSKDYEYLPSSSETMLYVAMINIMLRRLTRNKSNKLLN
jgi:putative transposase